MKSLDNAQILEIQQIFSQGGVSKAGLSRQFGVSPRTIARALEQNVSDLVVQQTTDVDTLSEEPDYHFIVTSESIQITKNGAETSTFLKSTDEAKYVEYVQFMVDGNVGYVYNEITPHVFLNEKFVGKFTVDPRKNSVIYHYREGIDYPMHGSIASRMIDLVKNEQDTDSIVNFAERLMENPTPSAVEGLYDFLLATNIEIDVDGYVIAYKKVRDDYKDVHSGKFDNSPGEIVSMPRHLVIEDRHETCSAGLHICSSSYLNSYPGRRIVRVKVDPVDFVSVPFDYYDGVNAKARVCKYEVLDDVTDAMKSFI